MARERKSESSRRNGSFIAFRFRARVRPVRVMAALVANEGVVYYIENIIPVCMYTRKLILFV